MTSTHITGRELEAGVGAWAWLYSGTCPLSMCQWQWQPGHQTTGLPGHRWGLRARPPGLPIVLTCTICRCHVPSCTLLSLCLPSCYTLDNKQRTAHWNFCFCHCRWFLRLLRRSSVAQCKAFCSFDRQFNALLQHFSVCQAFASFHFSAGFFWFLFFISVRVYLWLINRLLSAADCVKGSRHVISDGLSGPTSYKRCRLLSHQFSFQISEALTLSKWQVLVASPSGRLKWLKDSLKVSSSEASNKTVQLQ